MPRQIKGGEGWEWVKDGIWQQMMGTAVMIPEAPLQMTDGFELQLRYAAKVFPKD